MDAGRSNCGAVEDFRGRRESDDGKAVDGAWLSGLAPVIQREALQRAISDATGIAYGMSGKLLAFLTFTGRAEQGLRRQYSGGTSGPTHRGRPRPLGVPHHTACLELLDGLRRHAQALKNRVGRRTDAHRAFTRLRDCAVEAEPGGNEAFGGPAFVVERLEVNCPRGLRA